MHIETRLAQRPELGLVLAPRMLQSLEVLQLAATELAALIEAELQQNETLEVLPGDAEAADVAAAAAPGDEEPWERLQHGADGDDDPRLRQLQSLPAAANALLDAVREQLLWRDLPPELHRKVLVVAEHLDDRGFLPPQAELTEALGEALLAEAIAVLRSLEPRGLGAHDAVDALLLQLAEHDPDYEAIRALLTCHRDLVAQHKLGEVARRMRMPLRAVQDLLDRVRELDPHPAAAFASAAAARLRPDLVVREHEGTIEVAVEERDLPALGICPEYAALAAARDAGSDVKKYLRDKLEAARSLISAVDQRRHTLARVGAAVMDHQRDFLRLGEAGVRPLKMAEIAAQLGLHTSTISRAVADKWVQTTRGVFPLRSFFDGGRAGEASPEGVGRRAVLQRIRDLVAAEDPGRPLSDDDLVTLLLAEGLATARRTVTKHRQELRIPSSWERKRRASGR